MSTTFRPYAPDQMLLLPADLRAWLRIISNVALGVLVPRLQHSAFLSMLKHQSYG